LGKEGRKQENKALVNTLEISYPTCSIPTSPTVLVQVLQRNRTNISRTIDAFQLTGKACIIGWRLREDYCCSLALEESGGRTPSVLRKTQSFFFLQGV
jgi:hypothetical protein